MPYFPQLWVFAYFPTLAPELEVEVPLVTPYSLVFEGQCRPRPRETLLFLRQYFDTVRPAEVIQISLFPMFSSLVYSVHLWFLISLCLGYPQITWQPWLPLGGDLRLQFAGGWGSSRYRILFEGPGGRAWFLGECFLRQTMGFLELSVPSAPPDDIRLADRLTP